MWFNETVIFAVALLVQLIGVLSVTLARISERSAAQSCCQQIFLLCLLGVGGISVLAVQAGVACWIVCAMTLPLMAVGATIDLQRTPEYSSF